MSALSIFVNLTHPQPKGKDYKMGSCYSFIIVDRYYSCHLMISWTKP